MISFIKNCTLAILTTGMFTISNANAETWDMLTPYPDKVFHTANIIKFAKDVESETKRTFKIKVHSAGSLIKHADINKAVRRGLVKIDEFFLSRLQNENGIYGASTLPFLATDYPTAEKLWSAQKASVTALLAEQGLIPLFAVPWPPQGLYKKKVQQG